MGRKQINCGKFAVIFGVVGIVLSFVPIINNLAFVLGIIAMTLAVLAIVKKADKKQVIIGLVTGFLAMAITLTVQGAIAKKMEKEEAAQNAAVVEMNVDFEAVI